VTHSEFETGVSIDPSSSEPLEYPVSYIMTQILAAKLNGSGRPKCTISIPWLPIYHVMVDISQVLMYKYRQDDPNFSVLDLKADFRGYH
jgi:hypothetical protein